MFFRLLSIVCGAVVQLTVTKSNECQKDRNLLSALCYFDKFSNVFYTDVFNSSHSFLSLCRQLEIKASFLLYFSLFLTAYDPLVKYHFLTRPTQQHDTYIAFSQSGHRGKICYFGICAFAV